MKSITMIATLIVIWAAPTWGASIGLFADPGCASCNLSIPLNTLGTFYLNYVGNEPIVGAEFRVVGLPPDWFVSVTPRPGSLGVLGDPFGVGVRIIFPEQIGDCVGLFTVHVFSTRDVSDIHLRVTKHTTPSQPFGLPPCPWISLCDGPCDAFICVEGGEMFINSAQPCTVGVEPSTWSHVKGLYER